MRPEVKTVASDRYAREQAAHAITGAALDVAQYHGWFIGADREGLARQASRMMAAAVRVTMDGFTPAAAAEVVQASAALRTLVGELVLATPEDERQRGWLLRLLTEIDDEVIPL